MNLQYIQLMYNIFTKDNKAFDSPIMKNQYALSIISNLLIIAINLYQYNEFDLNSNKNRVKLRKILVAIFNY